MAQSKKDHNPITADTDPTTVKDELSRAIFVAFKLDDISKKQDLAAQDQARYEARMESRFESIDRKLSEVPDKYVSKEYFNERLESMNKDVESINANISKLVWLVVTAVVIALLSMVIMSPLKIGGL